MNKQLRPEDANAVDLLLNTAHGHDGKAIASTFVHHSAGAAQGRLAKVEQILNLLAEMPAPEPSEDLVAQTLARIDGSSIGEAARNNVGKSLFGGEQPHA